MISVFDHVWHRTLGRPYRLKRTIDVGSGPTVVLLHGIGSYGGAWQPLVSKLVEPSYRVVAFDLLGFGKSPKPDWLNYSVDDHAQAVIVAIKRLHAPGPVVIVGHSMGCLIAVRVARLEPKLVKHLVLYEMPLYIGLPLAKRYTVRRDMYFKIYQKLLASPVPPLLSASRLHKTIAKLTGLDVHPDMWPAFVKSLEHTIMHQTTLEDIKRLKLPMDIIYGSLDMVVIRSKPAEVFGTEATNITTQTIAQPHRITPKAGAFLARRIAAIMESKA